MRECEGVLVISNLLVGHWSLNHIFGFDLESQQQFRRRFHLPYILVTPIDWVWNPQRQILAILAGGIIKFMWADNGSAADHRKPLIINPYHSQIIHQHLWSLMIPGILEYPQYII